MRRNGPPPRWARPELGWTRHWERGLEQRQGQLLHPLLGLERELGMAPGLEPEQRLALMLEHWTLGQEPEERVVLLLEHSMKKRSGLGHVHLICY